MIAIVNLPLAARRSIINNTNKQKPRTQHKEIRKSENSRKFHKIHAQLILVSSFAYCVRNREINIQENDILCFKSFLLCTKCSDCLQASIVYITRIESADKNKNLYILSTHTCKNKHIICTNTK